MTDQKSPSSQKSNGSTTLGESTGKFKRSIAEPIREELDWDSRWDGPDEGMIAAWEAGRRYREQHHDAARRAEAGCLVELPFRGGFADDCTTPKKPRQGHLLYLAMWQGLRNEDLEIDTSQSVILKCPCSGGVTVFQK